MARKPSKTWVMTWNNYTDENIEMLMKWNCADYVSRFVVSKEVGEQGTPHLQGSVTFKNAKRITQLNKLTASKAHWEEAVAQDAGLYNIKVGSDVIINSDFRTQGTTKHFSKCVELIKSGELKRVREEYPEEYCRHGRKFKEYYRDIAQPRDIVKHVKWFHGTTGTGKTRTAVEEAGEDVWISNGDLQWFDGYTGQRSVIIDDLRGDVKFNFLLRLLDRYRLKVPIKGDFVNWEAEQIWITSPYKPEVLFAKQNNDVTDNIDQLLRRINEIKEF